MITNEQILELTDPLVMMYEDVATELIIDISKHLRHGEIDEPAEWKIKKLSEMGRINDEAIRIISKGTSKKAAMIRSMLGAALSITAAEVDKYIAGARGAGIIMAYTGPWEASEKLRQVLDTLIRQAEDDTNIVNTVMLDSTRRVYANAINYADIEMMRKVEQAYSVTNAVELEGKLKVAQRILNASTMATATGAYSRQDALMKAVNKMVNEGITGYIDAGGHKWSPEAYVNMDIRTTVHNTAVFAQRERAAEYGIRTFQISTKAAARPLCYPYQGWICSWESGGGTVHDANGNAYQVHSIYETSYGEPAGIFGINCGHFPETFIDGYSYPRYNDVPDKAVNDDQYELSQIQRGKERAIRHEKTRAVAQKAAGNDEASEKAVQKVKAMTKEYNNWCKENDRTARRDRLSIAQYR